MVTEKKLVCGVGVYEKGEFTCREGGRVTKEYYLWASMLARCYSARKQGIQPAYAGCSSSENFKNFQFFASWCHSQVGFGANGYHLDKDILIKGNKLYSEDTCVFVPKNVNNLLVKGDSRRGEWPVGVYFNEQRNKFVAQVNAGVGIPKFLGCFNTPQEAFIAYKQAKELIIKQVAEEHKDKLDIRVYKALLEYEVNVCD